MYPHNPYIIEYHEGDSAIYANRHNTDTTSGAKYHTVSYTDTLEKIATRYYKNPLQWDIIAETNNLINPFELTPGGVLVIPKI